MLLSIRVYYRIKWNYLIKVNKTTAGEEQDDNEREKNTKYRSIMWTKRKIYFAQFQRPAVKLIFFFYKQK